MSPGIKDDFEAVQEAVNDWRWKLDSLEVRQKQASLGRIAASHAALVAALERIAELQRHEGVEQRAFSLLRECGATARAALARARGEPA